MSGLLLNIIYSLTSGFSSLFSHAHHFLGGIFWDHLWASAKNTFINPIGEGVVNAIWAIEKFVLGLLEALEYAINSFLGIGTTINDYALFADQNNLSETFVKTFKAIVAIAIVFLIIFTIYAIIKQEWQNATNKKGFSADQNQKTPIIMKTFRGLMSIIVLPVAMVAIIGGINSVLTAFSRAMKGDTDYTVASSVLATSSYDANKYRVYAEKNYRVPIVIEAYRIDDYRPDEKSELLYKIKTTDVQYKLKNTRANIANVSKNLSFKESLTYTNNRLTNSSKYGDYYESFVCTPEQYQVLAEFIDYAQLSESNFYIRAVEDEFVEWKYVDDLVYNKDDKSLTINYRDMNDINNNGVVGDSYSITYSSGLNVTSPISNALESLQAILGIDEYSNILFNEMERDEDSVNVVQWANEKVSIHFSQNFDINDASTWKSSDEIILYEYYRLDSNNVFSKYKLENFYWSEAVTNNNPVTLDAYRYTYRDYYPEADAYSPEKDIFCVLINGNYYITVLSEEEMDEYGDHYYVLKEIKDEELGEEVKFLDTEYVTIFENKKETLVDDSKPVNALIKFTGKTYTNGTSVAFNINDQNTWSYTDQIIMYEYYKDLSYANDWSSYNISNFKDGIEVPTYTISTHYRERDEDGKIVGDINISGDPKTYVFINDVYYEVELDNDYYKLLCPKIDDGEGNPIPDPNAKFLDKINSASQSFYNYEIELKHPEKYGISTEDVGFTANDFIISNDNTDDDIYFSNENDIYSYYAPLTGDSTKEISDGVFETKRKHYLTNSIVTAFEKYTPEILSDAELDKDNDGVPDDDLVEVNEKNKKYAEFNLQLSSTFDYKDTRTWSYRDYFIVYLYSKYLYYSDNFILEQLKSSNSVAGDVGRVGVQTNAANNVDVVTQKVDKDGTDLLTETEKNAGIVKYEYYYRISSNILDPDANDDKTANDPVVVYLKIDDILNISEKNILNDYQLDLTLDNNNFDKTEVEENKLFIEASGEESSLLKTKTESRSFTFSQSFKYTDISTWTTLDYILLWLNEKGYIDISKALEFTGTDIYNADLSVFAYNSLVYVDTVNKNRYYCVGKVPNTETKVLLNEKYIKGDKYGSIDEWLNTPLVSVVSNSISNEKLTVETDSIANELYSQNNLSANEYSLDVILKKFVDEYCFNANNPMFEVYESLNTYTYNNTNFVFNDLTTWTNLDFILYYIYGKVENSYTFEIIKKGTNNIYGIIDNYAINLNRIGVGASISSNFSMSSKESSIKVDTTDETVSDTQAVTHYNTNINGKNVVEADLKDLILENNASYKYSIKTKENYTFLDLYILGLNAKYTLSLTTTKNTEFNFKVYKYLDAQNSNSYLHIGNTSSGKMLLIKLEENSADTLFSRNKKSSIELSANTLFEKSSEPAYVPFSKINENIYTLLDAVILNITKTIDTKSSYQIYKLTDGSERKFICVNNTFVEYIDDASYVKDVDIDKTPTAFTGMESDVALNYLYSNFYSTKIKESSPGYLTTDALAVKKHFKIDIDDITTWDPISIILYKKGIIENNTGIELSFSIRTSANNENIKYIYIENVRDNILHKYYIDITELGIVSIKEGTEYNPVYLLNSNPVANQKMYYNLILNSQDKKEENISNYVTLKNWINTQYQIKNADTFISANVFDTTTSVNNEYLTVKINKYNTDKELNEYMSTSDITTWTWFDILYYNYFKSVNMTLAYYNYISNNGQTDESFIKISSEDGSKHYFVKYLSATTAEQVKWKELTETKFKKSATKQAVTFDLTTEMTKLSIIFKKITGLNTGSVDKYEYDLNTGVEGAEIQIFEIDGKFIIIDPSEKVQGGLESNGGNTTFKYNSYAVKNNISSWNVLDLIIKNKVGNGDTSQREFEGLVYKLNGKKYFAIKDTDININITALGATCSGNSILATNCAIVSDKLKLSDTSLGNTEYTNYTGEFDKNVIALKNEIFTSGKINPSYVEDNTDNYEKIYFSTGFDFSNISTWKLSDFLIYYIFEKSMENAGAENAYLNFDESIKNFQHYVNQGYVYASFYEINFGDSGGGVKHAYIIGSKVESVADDKKGNYLYINSDLLKDLYQRKLSFVDVIDNDQEVEVKIVGSSKSNASQQTIKDLGIVFDIETTSSEFTYDNYYYFKVLASLFEMVKGDNGESILKVDPDTINKINTNASVERKKYVNLKLSKSDLSLSNISDWTILDYIILYEYSRNVNNNVFYGLTFEDLLTTNFLVKLYNTDSEHFVLKINGNYYNLKAFIENASEEEIIIDKKLPSGVVAISNILDGDGSSFKILYNSTSYNLNSSRSELTTKLITDKDSLVYTSKVNIEGSIDKPVISESDDEDTDYFRENVDLTYYRKLGMAYEQFMLSLTKHKVYTISAIVKKVNWPQKLMNDMKVIYPDLNWANLIATDGWIDTLGDYHSGNITGQFIESGNSANITAVGMVLSEFFLSVANLEYTQFSDYTYSSIFDEDTLNALMLAMLGEERYEALVMEAKIFVDLFNTGFATILEDVAADRGINIVDGKVNNMVMSIYKAYLGTAILSTDVSEYLYTVATRVYAQYTIYEALAKAGDNYAGYYAYMNGQTDEDGNIIDSFTYSSFYDLVKYENKYLNDGDVPVFTFNYASVYKLLVAEGDIETDKTGAALEEEIALSLATYSEENILDWVGGIIKDIKEGVESAVSMTEDNIAEAFGCESLVDFILLRKAKAEEFQKKVNENGGVDKLIADFGTGASDVIIGKFNQLMNIINQPDNTFSDVLNKYIKYYERRYLNNTSETISSRDEIYSFMLDVYWSIRQDLYVKGIKTEIESPVYLQLYMKYLNGEIKRWSVVDDVSIDAGSIYIKDYNKTRANKQLFKAKVLLDYNLCFGFTYNENEDESDEEKEASFERDFKAKLTDEASKVDSYVNMLVESFAKNDTCMELMKEIFPHYTYNNVNQIVEKVIDFNFKMFTQSELGTSTAQWEKINSIYEGLGVIVEEVSKLTKIDVGEMTEMESVKLENNDYDKLYIQLSSLYNNLGSYISYQNIEDKVNKTCITFTLAQYANNYVEEGLAFTIDNKQYNMKTATSALRLAEYVYGGKFLVQFGAAPVYTDENFAGTISVTTAYDDETGLGKMKLNSFVHVRDFARNIADYTGKLYYLTNFDDLSQNTNDSMTLTETIVIEKPIATNLIEGDYMKASLEYLILDYIIENEILSYETLYNLLIPENETISINSSRDAEDISDFEKLMIGAGAVPEDRRIIALRKYLLYVQTTRNKTYHFADGREDTVVTAGNYGQYGYYIEDGYTGKHSVDKNKDGFLTASDRTHKIFKKVITYLTGYAEDNSNGYETDYEGFAIKFENMDFKYLKTVLMNAMIDYIKYENSSGEDNTKRYLALLYLVSSEFNYYINDSNYLQNTKAQATLDETKVSRTLPNVNKNIDFDETVDTIYENCLAVCYKSFGTESYLRASFKVDSMSQGMVLKLANIPNRPIEELVELEYNQLYNRNGYYDEANGDSFVLCTYDEISGMYYPVLARNRSYNIFAYDGIYNNYLKQSYGVDFKTHYNDDQHAYPIIAKGIMTARGLPTAIKMVNGEITYYRTDITATTKINESSISQATIVSDVQTVGYTTYVNNSSFSGNIFSSKQDKAMYIGSNNPAYEFKSDLDIFYLQFISNYKLGQADEYFAVSVLDDYQSFYNINPSEMAMFHIMLFLGYITVMPVLFKALLAAMRRILDLMFLVLCGPIAISTNSLEPTNTPSEFYRNWKDKMTKTLLNVFGIVVSFSLYYILINTTMRVTFVTEGDSTMKLLSQSDAVGPLLSKIFNVNFLNGLVKFFFVIVASRMVQSGAELVGRIMTGGRVERAFNSQLSDTDPYAEMTKLVTDVKKVTVGLYTGEFLEEAMHAALETAAQTIPGSAIMRDVAGKISYLRDKRKTKKLSKMAQDKGVSKAKADKLSKELFALKQEKKKLKKQNHLKKANNFMKNIGAEELQFHDPYADKEEKKEDETDTSKATKKGKKKGKKKNKNKDKKK